MHLRSILRAPDAQTDTAGPTTQDAPIRIGNVTPEDELPEDFHGASKEELLKALEGVDLENDVPSAEEAAKHGKPPSAEVIAKVTPKPPGVASEADEDAELANAPPVVKEIRAREREQRAREAAQRAAKDDAEVYRAQLRAEAEAEAKRIRDEAIASASAERDKLLAPLKGAPHETVKSWPEEQRRALLESLAQSPEAVRLAQLEREIADIKGQGPKFQEKLAAYDAAEQQRAAQLAAYQRSTVEREYLDLVKAQAPTLLAKAEAASAALAAMGITKSPEQFLLERGHAQADTMKGVTGKSVVPTAEVVQYLEWEATRAVAAPPSGKDAPKKPTAGHTGSRSVTAGAASERRASPKSIREMTPAEERQALIDAVNEAQK